jgi:cytochrome c peroxidase
LVRDQRLARARRQALRRASPLRRDYQEPHRPPCAISAHGYAGNNGSQIGVARGSAPGRFAQRNTPSVLYLRFVRRFHLEWEEEAELPEAFGGFFWDGRANTVATVVTQPLLNPNEMGNRNPRQIADKLRASAYATELAAEFDHVFATPDSALEALGFCLEAFLISPQMSPFSSKYDEYLRGHLQLSPLEAQGLALFDDPNKAACSSCHKFDARSRLPEASLFTDYGYDTVSVPRNRNLPPNRNPKHFDLGLCQRRDAKLHTEDEWFCGSFRTPSLRNVATRVSFMHNGVFSKLRDVVRFYATRGSDPKHWYPNGAFDDLPAQYQKYVNVNVAPYNHAPGDPPTLSDQQIDAVVAFLETLSDAPPPP